MIAARDRKTRMSLAVIFVAASVCAAAPAPAPVPARAPVPERIIRFATASTIALPRDFVEPEGRTRWDLRATLLLDRFTRHLSEEGDAVRLSEDEGLPQRTASLPAALGPSRPGPTAWHFVDPTGQDAALRLMRPETIPEGLRPGRREQYRVDQLALDVRPGQAPSRTRLLATSTITGIGWVHLPSGPREVVLERLLLMRAAGPDVGFVPDRLVHRFIDPRAGVVAEISGPASPDGRSRIAVTEASVADVVIAGAADLRLYVHDLWSTPFSDILLSRDRAAPDHDSCTGSGAPLACCQGAKQGPCTPVSAFTPVPGITTIGQLIALDSWDFSGITTGFEVGATTAPMNAQETCNISQCGYTIPGVVLDRTDRNYDVPASVDKINASLELELRPSDTVIWLRSGAQHEGRAGSLGSGESRFCYSTFGGVTRTSAPLWLFPHQDTAGAERYILPGDAWTSTPFNCEQNLFNQVCGASQLFDKLYTKSCDPSGPDPLHNGTQSGATIKNGVVTTPSGHTFNAMLGRNVADFCVWAGAGCTTGFQVQAVRTVNYLWQVPVIGTVARIQSAINTADLTSWTGVEEGVIAYGPFPPRTIQVTATADTTVSLSWDPGLDTHKITGYKVYWDSDSGAATSYAFNSAANPGQAALSGTTAVISGLTPGTSYYFTVTSLSSFTSPSSGVTTNYETPLYPTQISGDPNFTYPIEVTATTTGGACLPTAEVTNVQVSHAAGGNITLCWNPVNDPCLAGYRILGAATPQTAAGYSTVMDTDLSTCWTGNPAGTYFLVVARGTGGTGPWGHYGQ
ncbi:MAG TPA: fibronectin type III domain-containing protein [Verrucomicrobiae bacterium]|nr:fibronectin type III domain-containing protein [Verrucomicrobiae bacterium]